MSNVMNEKFKCYCGISINKAYIKEHNKSKSHNLFLQQDILIQTIKNGTHKSKEQWLNDFRKLEIKVPQYVIDYDYSKVNKRTKYYNKNKDKINEKITCECGSIINKSKLKKHKQTKKHMKYESVNGVATTSSLLSGGDLSE